MGFYICLNCSKEYIYNPYQDTGFCDEFMCYDCYYKHNYKNDNTDNVDNVITPMNKKNHHKQILLNQILTILLTI